MHAGPLAASNKDKEDEAERGTGRKLLFTRHEGITRYEPEEGRRHALDAAAES